MERPAQSSPAPRADVSRRRRLIGAILLAGMSLVLVAALIRAGSRVAANQTAAAGGRRFPAELRTDFTIASINVDRIRRGGPPKDGIPALTEPDVEPIGRSTIDDSTRGILVEFEGRARFYPYNILVWHELVNDRIGDTRFLVSYCPLCGSGIVFDRVIGERPREFGVSGLLFESNLLMYDRTNESLWSQSLGEAVVGIDTGAELEYLPMQFMSLGAARRAFPDAEILTTDTGYVRDYTRMPYADYDTSERLVFDVSRQSERFHPKAMMYVVPLPEGSLAIPLKGLKEGKDMRETAGHRIELERRGPQIRASVDGKPTPGYYEMWFSWYAQHADAGTVWSHEGPPTSP